MCANFGFAALVPPFEPEVRDRICRTIRASFGCELLVRFSSRLVTLGLPRQHGAGALNLVRTDFILIGEDEQQGFIAGKVIEHSKQEAGSPGGRANRLRLDPGQRQESPEPLGLGCDKAQGRNRERAGGFLLPPAVRRVSPSMRHVGAWTIPYWCCGR